MGNQAQKSPSPLIGQTVGNFVIERKIGEGGMGEVFLVRHRSQKAIVHALKVLSAEAASRHHLRARFEQEAAAYAAVRGDRIVRPIDFGEIGGHPFILMEWVDGESLDRAIAREAPLAVSEALKIAWRVAATLTKCHEVGIIHRDVKASNVMIPRNKETRIKLLDFGIAHVTGELQMVQTRELQVLGSVGYMSPEVATGLGCDGRSDVFSLAVLLFELLTGELPWPRRRSAPEWIGEMLNKPPASLAERRRAVAIARKREVEDVPSFVTSAVYLGLELQPKDRPAMAAFANILGRILSLTIPVSPEGEPLTATAGVAHGDAPTEGDHDQDVAELLRRQATTQPDRARAQPSPGGVPVAIMGPATSAQVGAHPLVTPTPSAPAGAQAPLPPAPISPVPLLLPAAAASAPTSLVTSEQLRASQRPWVWALTGLALAVLLATVVVVVALSRVGHRPGLDKAPAAPAATPAVVVPTVVSEDASAPPLALPAPAGETVAPPAPKPAPRRRVDLKVKVF